MSLLSSEHFPPPLMIENVLAKSITQSVRLSCSRLQKPFDASSWASIVTIETDMMVSKGVAANLVIKPNEANVPAIISKRPTKGLKKSGLDTNPILVKRPPPKAAPAIRRIMLVDIALSVLVILLSIPFNTC